MSGVVHEPRRARTSSCTNLFALALRAAGPLRVGWTPFGYRYSNRGLEVDILLTTRLLRPGRRGAPQRDREEFESDFATTCVKPLLASYLFVLCMCVWYR